MKEAHAVDDLSTVRMGPPLVKRGHGQAPSSGAVVKHQAYDTPLDRSDACGQLLLGVIKGC